jgi:hypothetical protein
MTPTPKNPGTCGSADLLDAVYKPSWREKVAPNPGEAFAAEDINDLRPLRGALSRVIDIFLASALSQLSEAGASFFLKKATGDMTKTCFLFDRSHPLRK